MKKTVFGFSIICVFAIFLVFASGCTQRQIEKDTTQEVKTSIRIGWQTSWATQGQIAQGLKHPEILEKNGLKGEFKGFSYGGPLNEGALAGEVDVILTTDVPAVILLSKGANWIIVSRLIYFRDGILVPPNSPIKSIVDLKGKTIAAPFGSGGHTYAMIELEENGIDLNKSVTLKNLDILEQSALVQRGKGWGGIDAIVSWDPSIALFENENTAKMITLLKGISVVAMSNDFIKNNPEAAKNFMKSYIESVYYYATHKKEANSWFIDEGRIKFDPSILDNIAEFEPNMKAEKLQDVNVLLSDEDIVTIKKRAEFAYKQKIITQLPNLNVLINQSMAENAMG